MNKKIISKILSVLLVVAIMMGIVKTSSAKLGDSGIIRIEGEETITELLGGAKLHQQDISASIDGKNDYFYKYDSQYIETLPNSEGIKIVSWSYRNPEKWQMAGVSDIAANFEELNPGWLVVGGTNADFFNINGNGQMTDNAMENGEMINPSHTTSNPWWRGILGFTEDNELMAGVPDVTNYYTVHIYEDAKAENEESNIRITAVNPATISTTGVTILTKDNLNPYDLTGYKVAVGKYDIVRQTTNGEIFVKGYIKEIRDGKANERPLDFYNDGTENLDLREFFLISKDGSLDSLEVGQYVKVQKDYMNEWTVVQNSASYYWKILDKDEGVLFYGHSDPEKKQEIMNKYNYGGSNFEYITARKSRCLFGVKADGSYVMTVIGGTTSSGMTLSEAAFFMKEIGCIEAWDFDGGGSATLIARDEYGTIQTINTPSDAGDGTERRVGNALLMVVRDPGFAFSIADSTPTTIKLTKKTDEVFNEMTNITISINGQTINVADDQEIVEIGGLDAGQQYLANVSFTYEGENYSSAIPVQTKEYVERVYIVPDSHGFNISIEQSDDILELTNIVFDVEGKEYHMDNVTEFSIDGLVKGREYTISYVCTITNKLTGISFTREVPEAIYKTLEYELPQIITFEENRKTSNKVSIEYKYEDTDNLIDEVYILMNGEKNILDRESGIITFENLDFIANKYVFELVIMYKDLEGRIYMIESDELVYEKEECQHEYDNDCDEDCNICGEVRVVTHNWVEASCEQAKHCADCGVTEGEALGHDWEAATYDAPKTCKRCGATEGEPLSRPSEPNEEKGCKKCSKNSILSIISMIGLFSGAILILRRK